MTNFSRHPRTLRLRSAPRRRRRLRSKLLKLPPTVNLPRRARKHPYPVLLLPFQLHKKSNRRHSQLVQRQHPSAQSHNEYRSAQLSRRRKTTSRYGRATSWLGCGILAYWLLHGLTGVMVSKGCIWKLFKSSLLYITRDCAVYVRSRS